MLIGTAKPIALTLTTAAILATGGVAVPLTALASSDSSPTAGTDPTPSDSPSSDPTPTQSPTPTPTPTPTSTDQPAPTPAQPPPAADPPPNPAPPSTSGSSGGGSAGGGGGGGSTTSPSGTTTAALRAPNGAPQSSVSALMHAMPANLGMLGGASGALPLTAPAPGAAPLALSNALPQLPMVGAPPAVAPKLGQRGTPTALRAETSPLGMDDTTYRLVLTQMAWLSALLVFMSTLLTQLRLKRRRRARLDAAPPMDVVASPLEVNRGAPPSLPR